MENQIENLISETTRNLFKRAGFNFDNLEIEKNNGPEGQELFVVKIKSEEDCSLLLSDRGWSLKAFEYLARLMIIKKADQKISLIIDLNDFLEKRNNKISELARLVAKKVQATQKSYILRPMSAYERRLVHTELAAWSDITTESVGEEPKRRVVVRPHL